MAENTKNRLTGMLLSKSRRAQYIRLFAVLAACVVVAVAVALHQNGVAMTHEEQVLTCPVDGVVAHTHDESCYDADGNLVCTLPERELHTHTDDCYDEEGNLICGQEEVTEEHVHGPGCFTTVTVEDAPEMPAQNFTGELKDQDDNVVLKVEVEAPEGAFPANTTMQVEAMDANEVQGAVDEAIAQKTDGVIADVQAVDIKFFNEAGEEIEPAVDITVRFVSDFIAQNDNPYIVHVNNEGKGDVVDSLTDEQLAERNQTAANDELYIDANEFSPYVLVAVNLQKTLTASDGNSYVITVDCPAEAAVPQNAELEVTEITDGSERYEGLLGQVDNTLEGDVSYARFFDINILVNGEVFQPKVAVNVKVELDTNTNEIGDEVNAVEITDNQANVVDAAVDENSVSFQADGLPVYAVVGTTTLTGHVITANGESFTIEVTYGPEANIPDGAELQATEILEGTDEYEDYLKQSEKALESEAATDTDTTAEENNAESSEETDKKKEVVEEDQKEEGTITSARFFDVSIVKDGEKIEPAAPVQISIHYDDAVEVNENEQIKAIHFASEGTEVIDVDSAKENDEGVTDVVYTQDSFSVTGTVVQYLSQGWPTNNGEYVLIVKPYDSNNYYAVKNDGTITSVKYNSTTKKVTFDDLTKLSQVDNYKWTTSTDPYYSSWRYIKSGSKYLDPYQNSALTTSSVSVQRTSGGLLYNKYFGSSAAYLKVNENALKIEGNGSSTDSKRAVVMLAKDFTVDEVPDPTEDSSIDLGAPAVGKTLKSNNDGTYQLALSVTGKSKALEEHTTADVLVVFDTSGSMNATSMSSAKAALKSLAQTLFANNTADHPDTIRMKLLPFATKVNWRNNTNNGYSDFAWVTGSKNNNTFNNGYSAFETQVNSLDDAGNGGTNWEDALQRAKTIGMRSDAAKYVIFVSDGNPTYRNTKGNNNWNDWKQDKGVYGTGQEGETNVSRCYQMARDDAKALVDAGMNFYTIGVFGSVTRMSNLTAYAYSGSDSGQYPTGHYQTASDTDSLNTAFGKIVEDIQQNFSYTDVEIDDGITALTARALVTGQVNNYTYKITYVDPTDNKTKTVNITKNDNGTVTIPKTTYKYTKADGTTGTATTTAVTLKGATYDGTTVKWELDKSDGTAYKLEAGWTYEVSFTVWPTQRAYDTVADLANGKTTYAQLADDVKASIDEATMNLNTNTQASVTYRQITSKNGVDEAPSGEKTVVIENPPGVPLLGSDLKIVKHWNDSLDTSQLLDLLTENLNDAGTDVNYTVRLDVTQDKGLAAETTVTTAEYPNGFIYKPRVTIENGKVTSATWPEIDIAVAPGVMLSYNEAHRLGLDTATNADGTAKYSTVSYGGVTYYVLETGHRYKITEDSIDYHFEMTTDVDHLMIVDGVLKNLIMNEDGTIKEMNAESQDLTTLTATNNLKSGIDVTKVVEDASGNVIKPTDKEFEIECSILDKNGSPYTRTSETVGDNENDGIIYRVVAPSNAELVTLYEGKVDPKDNTRTKKIGVTNSNKFTVKLKAGWTIRFINVPSGSTYSFTEPNVPTGYRLKSIEHGTNTDGIGLNTGYECTVTNTMLDREVGVYKIKMGTTGSNIVPLKDATFVLKNADDKYMKKDNNSITWIDSKDDADVFTTGENGKVGLGALPMGDYKLEETQAPAGYHMPTSDVLFTVDANGVHYKTYDLDEPQDADTDGTTDATLWIKVPNSTGNELPNTGGIGTTVFYLTGSAVIAAGALYGLTLRRREA